MKKLIIELLIILIVILFQISFDKNFSIKGMEPDILLILTLYIAIYLNLKKSILFGTTIGLLEDLFSGDTIGLFMLSHAIITYIISYFKEVLSKDYIKIALPIIIFLGSFFTYEIEFIFAKILNIGIYSHILILKLSLINFLFSPLSYIFIKLIQKVETNNETS